MTIGPDPMISTDSRSLRRGMAPRLPRRGHGGEAVRATSRVHGISTAYENDAISRKPWPVAADITHVNLNDGVVEGIRCREVPAFSVQYHPEAGPGPHDARYLFDEFRKLMVEAG